MTGFSLIILSAFMHSLWNILLKKSENKYVFNYQMHIMNVITFSMVYIIFFREDFYFDKYTVMISFFAAAFFSLYHIFLTAAYSYEDVSKVYPITVASPFFILIWATVFLNERVTVLGFIGMLLIVIGVIHINGGFLFIKKISKGVMFAIFSMFFYSIGSIFDKIGVGSINFTLYVYFLIVFMTLFLMIFSLKNYDNHIEHFKTNFKLLILSGVILFLSFFTYRIGLSEFQVTYASALRQVSVLFSVVFGFIILREKINLRRLVGAIVIMSGIVIIRITL